MTSDGNDDTQTPIEREIWHSARRLIEQYGPHAEARALKRRIQMEEIRHEAATAVWSRILEAIRALLDAGTPLA